jgi:hypothetical protein
MNKLQTLVGASGNEVKENKVDPSTFTSPSFVQNLIPYLGDDKPANLAYIRQRLLSDNEYLDNISSKVLFDLQPSENYYNGREEEHLNDLSLIKTKIYDTLVAETYKGQTLEDAIVDRSIKLQTVGDSNPIPLSNYKKTLKKHSKEFSEFGIFDEDNKLNVDDKVLIHKLSKDKEFIKKLTRLNYESFVDVFSKSHNVGGIDLDNINEVAPVYAVYEQYGSEAVTDLINIVQETDEEKKREIPEEYKRAISEFYGSEESKQGKFEITPLTKAYEIDNKVDRDTNSWTNFFKRTNSSDDGLRFIVDQIRDKDEVTSLDRLSYDWSTNPKGGNVFGASINLLNPSKNANIPIYNSASDEEIIADIKDGVEGHYYRMFRHDIISQAEEGDLFTIQDLARTIMLNSERIEVDGIEEYIVDYKKLKEDNLYTKIAVDAMMYSPKYQSLFRDRGDELIFQPNIQERLQKSVFGRVVGNISTEEVPVYNDNGQFVGTTTQTSSGIIPQLYDTISGFSWEFSKFMANSLGEILPADAVMDWSIDKMKDSGNDDVAYKIEDWYESAKVPFQNDIQREGLLPNMAGGAGMLTGLLYSIHKAGGMAGSAVKSVANTVKATNLSNAGIFLKGGRFTEALRKSIQKHPKAIERSLLGLRLNVGENIMVSLAPENYSLLNDTTLDFIEDKFDLKTDELKRTYKTSNRLTQIGLDIVTTQALNSFIDGMFASVRFGKGVITGTSRGIDLDAIGENYVKTHGRLNTQFAPEMRRFYRYLTDGLAERPIGNIENSLVETMGGFVIKESPENIKNFSDFTTGFVRDAGEYMSDIKSTIRESVEQYDKRFNVKRNRYTEEDIEERVDRIYKASINNLGKQISTVLSNGSTKESKGLALKFYDLLMDESLTTTRVGHTIDKTGEVSYTMSFLEAKAVAGDDMMSVIKQNADNSYSVFKADGNYWTIDLAKSVRSNFLDGNKEATFIDFIKRTGRDINSKNPEVIKVIEEDRKLFNTFYGKEVEVEEGVYGRVIDMDKDGFVVMKQDGEIVSTESPVAFKDQKDVSPKREAKKPKNEVKANMVNLAKQAEETEVALKKDTVKSVQKEDKSFSKFGVTTSFWKRFGKSYKKQHKSGVRTILKKIGSDGTTDISKVAINGKKGIDFYDNSKISSKGLESNIAVKVSAGNEVQTFMTKGSTPKKALPSIWELDVNGKLVPNRFWSRVDKNQTFKKNGSPRFFVREEIDGDVWFRPSKNGRGVILNIQNPTKKIDVKDSEVLKNNIDGFYKTIDGKDYFKPYNEAHQVVDISNIKGGRPTSVKELKTKDVPKEVMVKDMKDELDNALKMHILNPQVLGAITGLFASEYFDSDTNPLIWAGIGALVTMKRVRSPLIYATRKTAEISTKGFGRMFSGSISDTKQLQAQRKLTTTGVSRGNLDKEGVEDINEFIDDIGKVAESSSTLKNISTTIFQTLFHNRAFQSSFNFLEKLGVPEAEKLKQHLVQIGNTIQYYGSKPTKTFEQNAYRRKFNKYVSGFTENGKTIKLTETEAKERALAETQGFADWYSEVGRVEDINRALDEVGLSFNSKDDLDLPDTVSNILGVSINKNRTKKDLFNEAYARIMHSGANTPEKLKLYNIENPTVKRAYLDNDILLEFDRALLKNDNFKDLITAERKAYSSDLLEYTKSLDTQINDSFATFSQLSSRTPEEKALLYDFIKSEKSFNGFRNSISDTNKQLLDGLKRNQATQDIIDAVNTKLKFTNLDGKYLPQMINRNRYIADQKRFIESNGLQNLSKTEKDLKYDEYMSDRIFKMNISDEAKKALHKYDEGTQKVEKHMFSSEQAAKVKLENMAINYGKNEETLLEAAKVQANVGDFIKEVIDKNGNTKYIIEAPDDSYRLLDNENRLATRTLFSDIKDGALIQHSNFLERPRVRNLPLEILEVDPFTIRKRYSYDIGRRMHARNAGIYTKDDLSNVFLSPIKRSLINSGVEDVQKQMDRIESMWNVMYGILGKTPAEIRTKMKSQQVADTIAKTLFSVFGFGFGKYNLYEWAVVAPQISSWNAVTNTLSTYSTNKQSISNMEQFLLNEGIISKQIGAFKPEYEALQLSEATSRDIYTWMDNKANKWANLSGNFSPGKFVADRFGADINGAGLSRLLPVVGDSFVGGNILSTSINARAALSEANFLSKIRRSIVEGEEIAESLLPKGVDKNRYTIEEVDRLLKNLGVSNPEDFMTKQEEFSQGILKLDESPNFVQEMYQNNTNYYEDIRNIVSYSTQTFHGTNRMFRPEGWSTSIGKLLSTFMTYPFNIARQMVYERAYKPMSMWSTKHKEDLGILNASDIILNKRRGNYDILTNRYGLSKEAIDEFPDHVAGAVKKIILSTGVSLVGGIAVSSIQDLLSYPFVDDKERWYNLKRDTTLNPFASEDEQITFSDIFEDYDSFDTWYEVANYGLASMARTGYFSILSSPIESLARGGNIVDRDGIMTMMPLGSIANDIFKGLVTTAVRPDEIEFKDAGKAILDWTPVLGSSYFSDVKRSLFSEKNKSKFKLKTTDGFDIDFDDINFNTQL